MGSKYVIEIDESIKTERDVYHFVKGFNALILDSYALSKLRPLDEVLKEQYDKGVEEGSIIRCETVHKLRKEKEEAYQQGFVAGCNKIGEELKTARVEAYKRGYEVGERKHKTVVEEIYTLSDEKKKEEYDRGYADGCAVKSEELKKGRTESYQQGFEDGKKAAFTEANETSDAGSDLFLKGFAEGMDGLWKMINYVYAHNKDQQMKWEIAEEVGADRTSMKSIVAAAGAQEFFNAVHKYIETHKKRPVNYKVGDEVIADNGTACFVITSTDGADIGGIDSKGETYAYFPHDICYKTGRHFDVEDFLKQLDQTEQSVNNNKEPEV